MIDFACDTSNDYIQNNANKELIKEEFDKQIVEHKLTKHEVFEKF